MNWGDFGTFSGMHTVTDSMMKGLPIWSEKPFPRKKWSWLICWSLVNESNKLWNDRKLYLTADTRRRTQTIYFILFGRPGQTKPIIAIANILESYIKSVKYIKFEFSKTYLQSDKSIKMRDLWKSASPSHFKEDVKLFRKNVEDFPKYSTEKRSVGPYSAIKWP